MLREPTVVTWDLVEESPMIRDGFVTVLSFLGDSKHCAARLRIIWLPLRQFRLFKC